MLFTFDESINNSARIKVAGIGGAGGNAINRMVAEGLENVEFLAINTDLQDLNSNNAHVRIPIGQKITRGLGAGSNPEIGKAASEENQNEIAERLQGADMVFITAGMGGGTGTGATPVIAKICKDMGILSVAVVTKPFNFEGPVRIENAEAGIQELRRYVDTIIVIPNQRLLEVVEKNTGVLEAFRKADEILYHATRGISDLITVRGEINIDFADAKTIMSNMGDALMGTGAAKGENRAALAANLAIHSPLLDNICIKGAKGVLVNLTGGENLGIHEVNDAMQAIYNEVGSETKTHIIFGMVIEPQMKEEMRVTVIATGFSNQNHVGRFFEAGAEKEINVPRKESLFCGKPSPMPEKFSLKETKTKVGEEQQIIDFEEAPVKNDDSSSNQALAFENEEKRVEANVTSIHLQPLKTVVSEQKALKGERNINDLFVNNRMPIRKEKSYKILSHEMDNFDIPTFLRQEK